MRLNRMSLLVLVVFSLALTAVMAGCPSKDSSGNGGASSGTGGTAKTPSGVYESALPDNTTFRLEFMSGGNARMTMIEDGVEDVQDMKWIVNGESIIVQSPDANMPIAFNWKGSDLTCDMGGMTLTFTKK
jgi:hypothetical protein